MGRDSGSVKIDNRGPMPKALASRAPGTDHPRIQEDFGKGVSIAFGWLAFCKPITLRDAVTSRQARMNEWTLPTARQKLRNDGHERIADGLRISALGAEADIKLTRYRIAALLASPARNWATA